MSFRKALIVLAGALAFIALGMEGRCSAGTTISFVSHGSDKNKDGDMVMGVTTMPVNLLGTNLGIPSTWSTPPGSSWVVPTANGNGTGMTPTVNGMAWFVHNFRLPEFDSAADVGLLTIALSGQGSVYFQDTLITQFTGTQYLCGDGVQCLVNGNLVTVNVSGMLTPGTQNISLKGEVVWSPFSNNPLASWSFQTYLNDPRAWYNNQPLAPLSLDFNMAEAPEPYQMYQVGAGILLLILLRIANPRRRQD
jgi:hypothetical protein